VKAIPDFESAVDTAPFGFCLVNANTFEILHANPAFSVMFNLPINPKGANLIDFLPISFHAPLFTQDGASFELELPYQQADTSERWLQIRGEMLHVKRSTFYVLWFIDVTLTREAEKQLRYAVDQAAAAAEMKSNLLATMSHEIRTPMQAVYGILEMLGEEAKEGSHVAEMSQTGKTQPLTY